MIYCIGNSHAHAFTGSHPGKFGMGEKSNDTFTSFSIGPVIAYNFMKNHQKKVYSILKDVSLDKNNDYVMLVVGEVDCRWHLPFQASIQGRTHEDIVDECADRFFESILDLKSKNINVIGWCGHPSTTAGHSENPSAPIFGDCIDRNNISIMWSRKIKKLCDQNNLPCVSIVEDLINSDTRLTKMEFFSDYCHLDPKKINGLIYEKFKKFSL